MSTSYFYIGGEGNGSLNITAADADITATELLRCGSDSTLSAVANSTIHMTGADFDHRNTSELDLEDLINLELIFEGGMAETDTFEVACEDKGIASEGFDSNFALGTLTLGGADVGRVRLVDNTDNGNRGGVGGSAEALYVDGLILNAGAVLDLNGLHLYYRTEFVNNDGSILNGRVRGIDLLGDFDEDGDVDAADSQTFCPGRDGRAEPCARGCDVCDLDTDGDVDRDDFALLHENCTGS